MTAFFVFKTASKHVNKQQILIRYVNAEDVSGSNSLEYAFSQYRKRGGRYIWGANDCSVFVSDYLSRKVSLPKPRLTTWDLCLDQVQTYGLKPANQPRHGDVVNYRYFSTKNKRMAGHCGVILKRQGSLWVIHNCATAGLVMERFDSFSNVATKLTGNKNRLRVLRVMKNKSAA